MVDFGFELSVSVSVFLLFAVCICVCLARVGITGHRTVALRRQGERDSRRGAHAHFAAAKHREGWEIALPSVLPYFGH